MKKHQDVTLTKEEAMELRNAINKMLNCSNDRKVTIMNMNDDYVPNKTNDKLLAELNIINN